MRRVKTGKPDENRAFLMIPSALTYALMNPQLPRVRSDFLCPRPTALSGAARAGDMWGQFETYNRTHHPDVVALIMDWLVVAEDMWTATSTTLREHGDQPKRRR